VNTKTQYLLAKLWWFGLESLKSPRQLPVLIKGLWRGAHLAEWVKMLRYRAWLEQWGIRTILDVGAHVGEFASAARVAFPEAMIYSFEPSPRAFQRLQQRMRNHHGWKGFPIALGDFSGQAMLKESAYSASSSLLPMSETHTREFPWTQQQGEIPIPVQRLDDLDLTIHPKALLKIDVQGYELQVLRGATRLLEQIDVCLIEVSFETLYQGESPFEEILSWMQAHGFRYRGAWSQFVSMRDGRILQQDALFAKESSSRFTD